MTDRKFALVQLPPSGEMIEAARVAWHNKGTWVCGFDDAWKVILTYAIDHRQPAAVEMQEAMQAVIEAATTACDNATSDGHGGMKFKFGTHTALCRTLNNLARLNAAQSNSPESSGET